MKPQLFSMKLARAVLLLAGAIFNWSVIAVTIPNVPLTIQPSSKPMIMLALGRDHRMFYEAYPDNSDIDGDGVLDIRFKPSIIYAGLFDSNLCYSHNAGNDNAGLFAPVSTAVAGTMSVPAINSATVPASLTTKIVPITKCPGTWSGNWLNYITTSRIDSLRGVLFGGMREVDTVNQTILRRAYIPQDAHSWGKEYTSLAVDNFLISDYTPLQQPQANRRHFFGSLTFNQNVNCATLSNCSDLPPWLSVIENSPNRIWQWASTERPVLANGTHGGTRTNYTVRVEVCTSAFNVGCKLYPSGGYKPVGLLHDFGENDAALFGLFSGSYDSHLSGGRLRKVISSFKTEVDQTNGVFIASANGIVKNLNAFRLYGFNRGNTNQIYQGGVVGDRPVNQGEFPDWGNPLAEMMYEATRYLANKGSPTADFVGTNTIDDIMGLTRPAWDKPYAGQGTSTAEAPYCARATLLTISDTNISFDSNQLPGVNANFGAGIATDLTGKHISTGVTTSLNVSTVADFITANEPGIVGLKFIGQSGATVSAGPTAKTVASLSSIRGLAPEEPTKQGSYYASSVAHFAKVNDLNAGLPGNQTVNNFFIALASPIPRITVPFPGGKSITLLPFAKSISGAFGVVPAKTSFQPTNQIVDYYVESIVNSSLLDTNNAINGGRYEAKFRINFEDVEQGNDHDMDAIVSYTVRANADGTLDVILQTLYEGGSIKHRMGYIISGSTNDGTYLVVQDEGDSNPYYLSVPPGRLPGYCDQAVPPGDCGRLPFLGGSTTITATASLTDATSSISKFTFTPSTTPSATFLKDPMWYAAKWGGFSEENNVGNNNARPDLTQEWDADGDGTPDTYFFVQNPTKLKTQLKKALTEITERQSSSSNLSSNSSGRVQTDAALYTAGYVAGKWIGSLEAFAITSTGVVNANPTWRAQEQLPPWQDRRIFLHASDGSVVNLASASFSSLPTATQAGFQTSTIYNYFRGDQSLEVTNGGTYRKRENILGDIIHSSPIFDPSAGLVYAGSNGGMLHAFDSKTGREIFSFVPQQIVPRLKNLSNLGYSSNHEYFVDGDVLRGLRFPQTNLTTYMYSLLGRGGKGLFSIKPNASRSGNTGVVTATPQLLWEYTPIAGASAPAGSTVSAAATDPDLGFMLSRPVFTLLNSGKAAVVVGNGYNSTNGKAVLYVFIINQDGTLNRVKKLDTGIGGDNGMAGASFFDAGANFTADVLYSGDLKGNVWKFDISDINPDNWKIAFAGNQPLFKATDGAGVPQPITAPVISEFNSYGSDANTGKNFVLFGTGSYFKVGDNNDLSTQSFYGLIDDVVAPTPIPATGFPNRTNLTQRQVLSYATFNGKTIRYHSQPAANDTAGKRGWFMDFTNPVNGERVISRAVILPVKEPAMQFVSVYPVNDNICIPGGDSYLNMLNHFTGAPLKTVKFKDYDPSYGSNSGTVVVSSIKLNIGVATTPLILGTPGRGQETTDGCDSACISKGNDHGEGDGPGKSEKREFMEGNSSDKEKRKPECLEKVKSETPGEQGRETVELSGDCGNSSIRGRVSWREIIKD
jgi:type IV pilus assembly protein PilY1